MHNVRDDMIKVKTIRYKGSYIEMSKSNYDMPALRMNRLQLRALPKETVRWLLLTAIAFTMPF